MRTICISYTCANCGFQSRVDEPCANCHADDNWIDETQVFTQRAEIEEALSECAELDDQALLRKYLSAFTRTFLSTPKKPRDRLFAPGVLRRLRKFGFSSKLPPGHKVKPIRRQS